MLIFKKILKSCIPPILIPFVKFILPKKIAWKGEYLNWRDAQIICGDGYSSNDIINAVTSSALKVKNGDVAFERDSIIFDKIMYSWPVTSSILWSAAREKGSLCILDFGGSLGSSYFQNLGFLKGITNVKWSIIEQHQFVSIGHKFFSDNQLSFYKSISDYKKKNSPNIILISSVLQYIEKPYDLLNELFSLNASIFVIDRTPFHNGDEDKIVIQEVSLNFKAKYPMHVFSKEKFLNFIKPNWNIIYDGLNFDGQVRTNRNLTISFDAIILEKK